VKIEGARKKYEKLPLTEKIQTQKPLFANFRMIYEALTALLPLKRRQIVDIEKCKVFK